MGMPLVSIVMPAYNSEKTIIKSIKSILDQSYHNWELLIVDDGSTDKTEKIVLDCIKKDKRIKLIKNNGKGVSSARNAGIDKSEGEYICFLDSDDLYSKHVLKNRVKFMKEKNVDATTCEIVLTDYDFRELGWVIKGKNRITFKDFHSCPVHTASVMFKKKVLENLRFDENISNGEDWLMWQRIARMGIDYYKVENCRVFYRQQNGAVRRNFLKHENMLLDVIDIVYGEDAGCKSPLEEYRYGITTPKKEHVILKRRIGLLNYLLLEKKYNEAKIIGNEIAKACQEDSLYINKNEVIAAIKYSTMRYYLCHANDYESYVADNEYLKKQYKKYFSKEIYCHLEKHYFGNYWTFKVKKIIRRLCDKFQNINDPVNK